VQPHDRSMPRSRREVTPARGRWPLAAAGARGAGSRRRGRRLDTGRIKAYIRISATGEMALKQEIYFISTAARLLGMHPQTLRKYERLGLVRPARAIGSMRVYTHDEIERLRLIKHLVDELGINLAGVQRLLVIAEALERIRPLTREELLARNDGRRRLAQELARLSDIVGL